MNNPIVSVIVPTYNSALYLEGCLRSIKEQSYENIELIVVDNNSKDNTKEIAQKFTDNVYNHGPERSAQRNFGVNKSKGAFLLIIDSDMVLSSEVVKACLLEMKKAKVKAVVIPEESFGEGFFSQCKRLERKYYVGVPWMEAARFFERTIFEEMNGYNEGNTGTEDYDLPQRIQNIHGEKAIGRVDEYIFHNEQRLSLIKTCRKKFYYAQKLEVYQSDPANKNHFNLQANPLNRYRLFFSRPGLLLKNPVLGLGMLFMKTCEYASGGAGYLKGRFLTRN